jgi:Bacterial archaeo-eukaryotic release factor family 3
MSVDRRDLDELLALALRPAVSILMPAARGGPDTRQSPIRLKNLTREAARQIEARGLETGDAERVLAPVLSLGEDRAFWRHQAGGLAIYAAPNFCRWLMADRALRERVAVADHFQITALLPALTLDRRFHVLALSQKNVRLIEATALEAHEVDLGDVPRSVSAALLLDTPDTQLRPYHVTDYKKEEALQFFHHVDRALRPFLGDWSMPLVLAAVDYLVPLYREANSHPALRSEAILGNPDDLSAEALAARAWEQLRPHFEAEYSAAVQRFHESAGVGRGSSDLATVLGAAHAGRVSDLMVAEDAEHWGTFEPDSRALTTRDHPGPVGEDLLNLAAVWTLERSGSVHVIERGRLPGEGEIAAIFRY